MTHSKLTAATRLRMHKHLDDGYHDRPNKTQCHSLTLAFDEIPNPLYPPRLILLPLLLRLAHCARTHMPDESKTCILHSSAYSAGVASTLLILWTELPLIFGGDRYPYPTTHVAVGAPASESHLLCLYIPLK